MPQLSLRSPIGDLSVSEEAGVIVALDWGWGSQQQATPLLRAAKRQLDCYFDGTPMTFDLPLAPQGTAFQVRVWEAMTVIPYGRTQTYGEIARDLNSGPRPVGTACGRNPIPIIIPCHRVLAAGGALGGYSGDGGLDTKFALLRLERADGFVDALPFAV
ncbi:MAG TPA: methylated-DNA--[protein]-cysteine S-methyltransferase [Sneathiellales bacterium]|jgi:methylated-DNA-[protein]-cysteine S-methyltransferase|nr:methylated-DNA--[protein]-cysteine S-methyltransferase [Sneathiellales bacterium]